MDIVVVEKKTKNNEHTEIFVTSKRDAKSVYTEIYERNIWRGEDSRSGRGSSLEATTHLLVQLEEFLNRMNIRTLVDAPCGDYNWFNSVNHKLTEYTGYDIVTDMINTNNIKYATTTVEFEIANILDHQLKTADLILCRDFLIHSSYQDIFTFFSNLKRCGLKGILMSHYKNCENIDIETGNRYRPLDFTKPPFNFPPPYISLTEDISSMLDTANKYALDPSKPLEKYLAYWNLENLFKFGIVHS